MPEFPRYQSKAQPTTQQPSVGASDNTDAQMIESVGKAGAAVADAAIKWDTAVKSTRKTVATINQKNQLLDNEQKAENENNPQKLSEYINNVEKINNKNAEGLDALSAAEIKLDARISAIKIENQFKKKTLALDLVATQELKDFEVNNPSPGSMANIKKLFAEKVATESMDIKVANDEVVKANKEIGTNVFYNRLNAATSQEDAQAAVASVRSGEIEKVYGVTIDPKDKSAMIKAGETMGRQINTKQRFAKRIAREELVHDLINQSNHNLLQAPVLEEAFLTKGISNSTYTALSENIQSEIGPTAETKPQTYYDLTNYLLGENVTAEDAIKKILDANSKGDLSRNDMKKLYEMHLTPSADGRKSIQDMVAGQTEDEFDKMKSAYDAKVVAINSKKGWFKASIKSFDEHFKGPNRVKEIATATQQLIEAVNANEIPEENFPAAAEYIVGMDIAKKYPQISSFPKEGTVLPDRFGNNIRFFPDGKYKLEPKKAKK